MLIIYCSKYRCVHDWSNCLLCRLHLGYVLYEVAVRAVLTECLGARHGAGVHEWNLSILQGMNKGLTIVRICDGDFSIDIAYKYQPSYLTGLLTPIIFLFLKTSFFILYLQLFQQYDMIKMFCWIGLVNRNRNRIYCPGYNAWNIHHAQACRAIFYLCAVRNHAQPITLSAIGLAFDLVILALPVYVVSGLNLSRKRKIGMSLVFLSGAM
jgi:hypothetical protein